MSHVDDGQLNALLDGELAPADAQAIEAHVASCAVCARRLEEARQFLAESSSLLDVLVPPELPVARPEVPAPAAGLVGATPVAPALDLAPAVPAPAAGGERRPTRTAKEVALDIDGSTQKSPAIRPIFPREVERRAAAAAEESTKGAPKRRVDWTQLAWAATVVLAMGVTWMVSEIRHAGGAPSAERVAVNDGASTATAAREPAAAVATGPAAGAGAHRRAAPPPRAVATKPPNARGNKPLPAEDATPIGRTGALASRARDQAGLDRASAPAAMGAMQAPAPPAPVAPTTPRQQPPTAAANQERGERLAPPTASPLAGAAGVGGAGAPAAPAARAPSADLLGRAVRRDTAREEVLTSFRRITLDQAARRLSGAIRLIDGRPWDHVEVGPGRLVPGSDRLHDVVRVFYFDDRGRPLILDQQRIPAPADTAGEARAAIGTLGMAPGDTLVTTAPSGLTRIRWLDRKYFWLSLSGNMPADSLRMLVVRVR